MSAWQIAGCVVGGIFVVWALWGWLYMKFGRPTADDDMAKEFKRRGGP